MARIYAQEEPSGRRFLAFIECDGAGCEARIKPHPEIASSGWVVTGQLDLSKASDRVMEWYYCPRCK